MKKVLVITYYWPPSGGSGVQRWLKFAKYLPEYGWEPVIYTPLNPEANSTDEALMKDVRPGTTVLKRRILEPYSFYKILAGGKNLTGKGQKKQIKANLVAGGGEKKSLVQKLSLFVRGNLFIPDPRILWVGPSVRYLKKYLKQHPVDAIVSTGPPHTMHLIAKRLSKATGTPWLADFRDPWTEIFYFKHLGLSKWAFNRHRSLEQGVLDSADSVVVVSSKMQKDFEKRTKTPVEIITNGFDPEDFTATPDCSANGPACREAVSACSETAAAAANFRSGKFTLVHTGLLVDNGNPNLLWEVLGEKAASDPQFRQRLEIRTMGQTDGTIISDISANGLDANFVNMGYVAHGTAVEWQQKASLLLLPLRKEPEAAAILTGKFFEYLAAGPEILAFGPTDGDLARALEETQSGTICDWHQKQAIRDAIDAAWANHLAQLQDPAAPKAADAATSTAATGTTATARSAAASAESRFSAAALKYSRKELTGKLSGLLNDITNKK